MLRTTTTLVAALLVASCSALSDSTSSSSTRIHGLHVEVAGHGPTVVLIHGGQLDGRMWDREFEHWSKQYRVVRYDVRGFGRSDTPTEVYEDVEDLRSVLDALDVGRAHLVGLSLGGRIAIDFTLTHPERVASLVTVGPGLSGFPFHDDAADARYIAIVQAAQDGDSKRLADLWLSDPFMAPAMEHPELVPRLRELTKDNLRSWLVNPLLEKTIRNRAAGRLAEIHAPTLVLVGTRDVPSIQAICAKLAQEVPGARRVEIHGAGHMVNMEAPAEFDAAVLPFLAETTRLPQTP
jgi:pimeloyl-ACP methyl ester carboxylesterase